MKTNTGILELSPFMSALITEEAFFAGGDVLHNPEVYVLANDGVIYQYHQFSLGRSAMMEVAKTPIRTAGGKSLLKSYLKPLVNDKKIPVTMLEDIVEFFKEVMKLTGTSGVGHGDYEAMAHIVWNKTSESYRVAIPKQKVSKAAVTYTWDHVKEDEEVILDIHSHNTMDAFFSGTDERDDATYVGISGVAGRLNTASPRLIWRFNAYKSKQAMELEGIFELPVKPASTVVSDWMQSVEVQRYTQPVYQGYRAPVTGSRVFGGGSHSAGGSAASERNPREDSWDARFQGQGEERLTASARTERSQASIDILGEDDGICGAGSLLDLHPDACAGLTWDETVTELADSVWQEEDEELTTAIASELAQRVVDPEVLMTAGLFLVVNSTDARKAVERLQQDFDIRSA